MSGGTMQAAYFQTPGKVELRSEPVPEPAKGQVLVKVLASGICGSDVAVFRRVVKPWHRMGHEYAGVVAENGPEAWRFKAGDMVAGVGSMPCRVCANCKAGLEQYCLSVRYCAGKAFAEYVARDENFFWPVPTLAPEQGALIEPLTVALQLVADTDLRRGQRVLVAGGGPIGLMAMRLCRLRGAGRVYVSELSGNAARVALAGKWGADAVVCPDKEDPAAALKRLEPAGLDRALITARPSQVLAQVVDVCAIGARIAYVGVEWEELTTLKFPVDRFHFSKLHLVGSNHNPHAGLYAEGVKALESGDMAAEELITHRFPLSRIEEAFKAHEFEFDKIIKAMIV